MTNFYGMSIKTGHKDLFSLESLKASFSNYKQDTNTNINPVIISRHKNHSFAGYDRDKLKFRKKKTSFKQKSKTYINPASNHSSDESDYNFSEITQQNTVTNSTTLASSQTYQNSQHLNFRTNSHNYPLKNFEQTTSHHQKQHVKLLKKRSYSSVEDHHILQNLGIHGRLNHHNRYLQKQNLHHSPIPNNLQHLSQTFDDVEDETNLEILEQTAIQNGKSLNINSKQRTSIEDSTVTSTSPHHPSHLLNHQNQNLTQLTTNISNNHSIYNEIFIYDPHHINTLDQDQNIQIPTENKNNINTLIHDETSSKANQIFLDNSDSQYHSQQHPQDTFESNFEDCLENLNNSEIMNESHIDSLDRFLSENLNLNQIGQSTTEYLIPPDAFPDTSRNPHHHSPVIRTKNYTSQPTHHNFTSSHSNTTNTNNTTHTNPHSTANNSPQKIKRGHSVSMDVNSMYHSSHRNSTTHSNGWNKRLLSKTTSVEKNKFTGQNVQISYNSNLSSNQPNPLGLASRGEITGIPVADFKTTSSNNPTNLQTTNKNTQHLANNTHSHTNYTTQTQSTTTTTTTTTTTNHTTHQTQLTALPDQHSIESLQINSNSNSNHVKHFNLTASNPSSSIRDRSKSTSASNSRNHSKEEEVHYDFTRSGRKMGSVSGTGNGTSKNLERGGSLKYGSSVNPAGSHVRNPALNKSNSIATGGNLMVSIRWLNLYILQFTCIGVRWCM